MYKYLLLPVFLFAFAACTQQQANTGSYEFFGEEFTTDNVLIAGELEDKVTENGKYEGIVEGKAVEICQRKGCWMNIDLGNGNLMRVTFKDYGFFVPMDAAGKTMVMNGFAFMDTTTVETLRHYADDAGKTDEEIEAITEPEYSLNFEASGVFIREEE